MRLGAVAVSLAVVAFSLLGCGGGNSNPRSTATSGGRTPQTSPTQATLPLPTNGGGTPGTPTTPGILTTPVTPASFEALRDALAAQLDAIGPNIGSVPGDVQRQILVDCSRLADHFDRKTVALLCNAIVEAMRRVDPGLIDIVVNELHKLRAG